MRMLFSVLLYPHPCPSPANRGREVKPVSLPRNRGRRCGEPVEPDKGWGNRNGDWIFPDNELDPLPLHNSRGYTLFLVMLILSTSAILFSISIANIRRVRVTAKKEVQKVQAKLLAESGFVRTEYFLNGGDGHSIGWETNGYEEKVDTFGIIQLRVARFGLFSRVSSTGIRRTTAYSMAGLFGRTVPGILEPALTLTGHVGGLILHKGSSVEGKVVLHHGYVYARKKGRPLPDYTRRLILRESGRLPFDSLALKDIFEGYRAAKKTVAAETKNRVGSLLLDGTNDSLLARKPLVVDGDCRITSKQCNGAELIVSGTCTILPGAAVSNTSCLAGKVEVDGGTTDFSFFFSEKTIDLQQGYHNSQFLACDSITVHDGVTTGTMSVFSVFRTGFMKDSLTLVTGGIYCDPGMHLRGTFISGADTGVSYSSMAPSINFGNGSTINGTIVTDGDCYLYECAITGRLWARAIVARDTDGSYTNYLISSSINLPVEETPFPLLGEPPVEIVFRRPQ